MYRRIVLLLVTLLTLTGMTSIAFAAATVVPANAKDVDCSNFGSQASAQNYFINHGGPNSDPDGLDADGDGVACESNPCPCNESTGGGGGNNNPPAPTKKSHVINLRIAKAAGNVKLVGNVPTYRGKFQVQRKLKGGAFQFYTRTQARNPGGKVGLQVKGPKGTCFKVSVPATKKYKLTTNLVGCIR